MDSLGSSSASASNVLSFAYPDGGTATIVVSKNAGRYRIQATSFPGLFFITSELCRRLGSYFNAAMAAAGGGAAAPSVAAASPLGRGAQAGEASSSTSAAAGGSLKISLVESLPLGDLFDIIDEHFGLRCGRPGTA